MFKKILQLMKSTSRLDDDKLKKVVNTKSLSLGGDRERNNLTLNKKTHKNL